MLIFDEQNQTVILDDLNAPMVTEYYWILNLESLDFTLTPLLVLEEIICPTIIIGVRGFYFPVPANWNILIVDEETTQLDTVEISELAGRYHTTLLYGPDRSIADYAPVSVYDYKPTYKNIAPSLNKHHMLCHPISPEQWINISPSDTYNKYLKNLIVGDLI